MPGLIPMPPDRLLNCLFITCHTGELQLLEGGQWMVCSRSYRQDAGVGEHRFRVVLDPAEPTDDALIVIANLAPAMVEIHPIAKGDTLHLPQGSCTSLALEFGHEFTVRNIRAE